MKNKTSGSKEGDEGDSPSQLIDARIKELSGCRGETLAREAGDSFVVWVRRTARGSGSGVQLEDRSIHVWTFRGKRVIRMELFEQESAALEAVGLGE